MLKSIGHAARQTTHLPTNRVSNVAGNFQGKSEDSNDEAHKNPVNLITELDTSRPLNHQAPWSSADPNQALTANAVHDQARQIRRFLLLILSIHGFG